MNESVTPEQDLATKISFPVTPRNPSWRNVSLMLGLAVSIILLALLGLSADLGKTGRALAACDRRRLPVPLLLIAAILALRALRWRMLFPAAQRPGVWISLRAIGIGAMANNLLPARGGDLARCLVLRTGRHSCSAVLTLGTLAIEKLLDGFSLLLVVFVSLFFWQPPAWLGRLAISCAPLFGGALLVFFLLATFPQHLKSGLTWSSRRMRLGRPASWLAGKIDKLARGLGSIRSPGRLLVTVPFTLLIWAAESALVWAFAQAMGFSLGVFPAVLAAAILSLAMIVPAAPAALGTYEMALASGLGLFSIGFDQGLAVALVMHFGEFMMSILIGLVCMFTRGPLAG